jgi:hypothetical protein
MDGEYDMKLWDITWKSLDVVIAKSGCFDLIGL